MTVVDSAFFSSSENGLPLESGYTIEYILPKMLPGEGYVSALKTA